MKKRIVKLMPAKWASAMALAVLLLAGVSGTAFAQTNILSKTTFESHGMSQLKIEKAEFSAVNARSGSTGTLTVQYSASSAAGIVNFTFFVNYKDPKKVSGESWLTFKNTEYILTSRSSASMTTFTFKDIPKDVINNFTRLEIYAEKS